MVEHLDTNSDKLCINSVNVEKSGGKAVCGEKAQIHYRIKGCNGCPKINVAYNRFNVMEDKPKRVLSARPELEI